MADDYVPYVPIPYTPLPYVSSREYSNRPYTQSLMELVGRAGQREAEATRRRSELLASRTGALGQIASSTLGSLFAGRDEAAKLAAAREQQRLENDYRERTMLAAADERAAASAERGLARRYDYAKEARNYTPVGQAVPRREWDAIYSGTPSESSFTPEDQSFEMNGSPYADSPTMTRMADSGEQLAINNASAQERARVLTNKNRLEDIERQRLSDEALQKYREAQLKLGERRVSATESARTGTEFPGDFNKTGDDFLLTIPQQARATVKSIANYDIDPAKTVSMRGNGRERIMAYALQANPDYDASMFSVRAPMRKAFTSGKQGQQVNSLNTAMRHLDQLDVLAAELETGGFVPGNRAVNALATMFGAAAVNNFNALKDALTGEVDNVLSMSGSTVSGRAEARDKINASQSPTQLAGYVNTIIPVLGSKLVELDGQYRRVMGERDPLQLLSPDARNILIRRGFDPTNIELKRSGGDDPSTGVEEWEWDTAPDGSLRRRRKTGS